METERVVSMLEGQFGGHPPKVQDSLCLNSRFRAVGCHRCTEGCPTQAITLTNGHPQSGPGSLCTLWHLSARLSHRGF